MDARPHLRQPRGFTLVELMITLSVIAVVVLLAAPSFRGMIEAQRLRGTHTQAVTDLQFARSEAVSRQQPVVFRIGVRAAAPAGTCYAIYTCNATPVTDCDCQCGRGAGSACAADPLAGPSTPSRWAEIRTVEVPTSSGVAVSPFMDLSPPVVLNDLKIAFDPRTGGAEHFVSVPGSMLVDTSWVGNIDAVLLRDQRVLRARVNLSGRPGICSPAAHRFGDTPAC